VDNIGKSVLAWVDAPTDRDAVAEVMRIARELQERDAESRRMQETGKRDDPHRPGQPVA